MLDKEGVQKGRTVNKGPSDPMRAGVQVTSK